MKEAQVKKKRWFFFSDELPLFALLLKLLPTLRKKLFRERLSYKRGKAHATMSKVIMGNGSFYVCLIEPQGVSAWRKETAQTHVFMLSPSLLINHLKPPSSKAKPYYP